MKTGQSHVGDLLWDANDHSMTNLVDENIVFEEVNFLEIFLHT